MTGRALRTLGARLGVALFACAGGSGPGCAGPRSHEVEHLVLRASADVPFDVRAIAFDPAWAVQSARAGRAGWLSLEVVPGAGPLTVRVPGMCPVTVPTAGTGPPVVVVPLIDVGEDRAQIGFDAPFDVHVRAGCAEARAGHVRWAQLEGPPLADFSVRDDGAWLHARTLPLEVVHPLPLPPGIVPITPATQGRYVLEATWTRAGWPEVRRRITVTSVARATGLASVAVSQELLLGGAGWTVDRAPRGGRGIVHPLGLDACLFAPDAQGEWRLRDENGNALVLNASWHDRTPVDCGRRECHPSAAEEVLDTPMTHALDKALAAAPGMAEAAQISCRLDCHTTGERGLHDGGFLDVADSLGWNVSALPSWNELPQTLRRLGGVRCTSCHGPGAIPDAQGRSRILSSDVCATCHDAPPTYIHVQEWRSSRMSRADAALETRTDAACARCHTTAGFLDSIGVRPRGAGSPNDAPIGIACPACHAPHGPHIGDALVRAVQPPTSLGPPEPELAEPKALLCTRCHAPVPGERLPSASAAAIWAGRVQVPSSSPNGPGPDLVTGPADHAKVPGGCVGCHGGPRAATDGALDHSFRVDGSVCDSCHASTESTKGGTPLEARASERYATVREWALELQGEVAVRCRASRGAAPAHPAHAKADVVCSSPGLRRSLYLVSLVLEDPGAGVHNARFSRQLLAEAEGLLER